MTSKAKACVQHVSVNDFINYHKVRAGQVDAV
jgi:hypothetical protein